MLTAERTAINQYYIHAKLCENWGYKKLNEWKRKDSIEEMKESLHHQGIRRESTETPEEIEAAARRTARAAGRASR